MTQSAPKRQNYLIFTIGGDKPYYTNFKVDIICIHLGNIFINLYPNLQNYIARYFVTTDLKT